MRAFTMRVREVVEYDLEIQAPDISIARYAAQHPGDASGAQIGDRSEPDVISRQIVGEHMRSAR